MTDNSIQVPVLFFAKSRELVGNKDGQITTQSRTTADRLHRAVVKAYPGVKMDFVALSDDPLSVDEASKMVSAPEAGAISLFIGITRNHFEGNKVARLEYEAYVPMAEKEIKKICKSIRDKWTVTHICILHRLGVVPVEEASVIIAISSEHRRESLEAVQFAIDTLKASVPIWKKEIYEEGEASWKANKECDWQEK